MEEKISRICNYLSKRVYPQNYTSSQKQNLRHLSSKFSLIDGTLYHFSKGKKRKVVTTLSETQAVFNEFHHASAAGNHNGIVKTREAISAVFYWPGMSKDIEDMVERCEKCRTARRLQSLRLYYPGAVLSRPSNPQSPLLDAATSGESTPWRLWQAEGEGESREGEGGDCDSLTPATEGHLRVIVVSSPGPLSVKEEEEEEEGEEEVGFKPESRESDVEAELKLERDQELEQHSDPDTGAAAGPEGAGRQAGTGSDGHGGAGADSGAGLFSDADRLGGPARGGALVSRGLQRSHARWSDEDTLALLSVVARMGVARQLDRKCRSSAGLWERVRVALAERAVPREAGLICSRWNALKQMYWKEKARRGQCGVTGSNKNSSRVRFFKTMDVLLTRSPREPRDEDSSSGSGSPSLPGLVPPSPPHPPPRPIPDPGSSPSSLDSSPFTRDWGTDAQRDTEEDRERESSGWGQSALQPPLLDTRDPTASLPYSGKTETDSHSQGPAPLPEGCTAGFQERALSLLSDFLQEQRSFHAQLLQEQRELRAALERTLHTQEQGFSLLRQLLERQGGGATPRATPPAHRGGGGGVTQTGAQTLQTTTRGHTHPQNSA